MDLPRGSCSGWRESGRKLIVRTGIHIAIDYNRLADICRRYHIEKLWLFGSVLREDFRADSDVDVLVLFEEGRTPGLEFVTLQDELGQLFGRPVDLVSRRAVERSRNYIRRQHILSSIEPIYEAR